jgi:hypothetical protein
VSQGHDTFFGPRECNELGPLVGLILEKTPMIAEGRISPDGLFLYIAQNKQLAIGVP